MLEPSPSARGRGRSIVIAATVLLTGAVLMATEVIAFRILGRTFGSALRETSAVIAVFLAAMSVGYWLGGRAGDRRPILGTLVAPLALAAAWIALVPLVDRSVCERVATSSLPFSAHALVASLVLFAAPAGLMAAVSPIAIRLSTEGVSHTGRVAGRVTALSAVGSIAGTLVTGFHLIGAFPLSGILRGLAAVLAVLALVVLASGERRTAAWVPAGIALLFATPAGARVVAEIDSAYHNIRVVDRGAYRHLLFDDTRQSRMRITDPNDGGYPYTRLFHTAWIFCDPVERVLFIGLGGGTGPKEFLADYPDVQVDVAEVDPAVVRVAHEYFGLPPDGPRLRVETIDGRVALRRRETPVDAIVVDAYTSGKYGSMIPFHLTTVEFFEQARATLTEDGVLLYNVVQQMEGFRNRFLRALVKTLRSVFAEVYLFETHESGNTVVVAVRDAHKLDVEAISLRAATLVAQGVVTERDFEKEAAQIYDGEIATDDVPLLTDDYAPVEELLGR